MRPTLSIEELNSRWLNRQGLKARNMTARGEAPGNTTSYFPSPVRATQNSASSTNLGHKGKPFDVQRSTFDVRRSMFDVPICLIKKRTTTQ